jgi:hypothetical protein
MNNIMSTFFKKYANSICKYVDECYGNNVVFQLASKMPILTDKYKVIFSPNEVVEEKLSEHYIFKEVIDECCITKKNYENPNEIKTVLKSISNAINNKLDKEIAKFPYEYLFCLQQMMDYNIQISLCSLQLLSNNEIEINDIGDRLCKDIYNSFIYQKKMLPSRKRDLDKAMIFLNNLLARDKQVIQKTISYIVSREYQDFTRSSIDIYELDIVKLLNLSRAMMKILELQDIQKNNKELKISVSKNNISSKLDERKIDFQELDNQIRAGISIVNYQSFDNEISSICKKHLGLSIAEIYEFSNQVQDQLKLNTFIFGTKPNIINTFCTITNLEKNEIERLFDFLTHKRSFSTNSGYLNHQRYLRKPIINYGKVYFSVHISILCFALISLVRDIHYGELPESELKKDLQVEINNIQEKFEWHVAELICEELPHAEVFVDIKQNSIPGIDLYGQIDILVKYNSKVFVIECKSLPLKYNTKSQTNENKRLGKEFQIKLDKKVRGLRENKIHLQRFLNSGEIGKIIGIIILKYPQTSIGYFKEVHYSVLHFTDLMGFIKNYK